MAKYRLPLLNSLRAFEAAARHLSIKEACNELHVTHGAVSRQIKKLERQIGRRLFQRHHRQIKLTEAGALLQGAVTIAFSHIQRAFMQLSSVREQERLVISVDPDFAALWLVPRLAEFYAIVPRTLVEILAEKTSIFTQHPRVNCAVQYAEAGLNLDDGVSLFRSRLFPVCARDLGRPPPLRSAQELRHHVLLHDRSLLEWQEYLMICPADDVNAGLGIVFSNTAHCLEAAARGQGVALGDDYLAANYLTEGRLVKPFGTTMLSKNAYYLIVPRGAMKHPAVNAFRAWIIRTVERRRKEF